LVAAIQPAVVTADPITECQEEDSNDDLNAGANSPPALRVTQQKRKDSYDPLSCILSRTHGWRFDFRLHKTTQAIKSRCSLYQSESDTARKSYLNAMPALSTIDRS